MPLKPKKPPPVEVARGILPRLDLRDLGPLDAEVALPNREILASKLRLRLKPDVPRVPDFNDGTEAEIEAENLRALSIIYVAAELEAIKLFAVADKIAEQFIAGARPIDGSGARDELYRFFKDAPNRLPEAHRRDLYARCFGPPLGSSSDPSSNAAFLNLWHRFLGEAAGFPCDRGGDERQQAARRTFESARDLAINLSLHGDKIAPPVVVELHATIRAIVKILSHPEILKAYGVQSFSHLLERVSSVYLGAAVNTVRGRALAMSGAAILSWLAERAASLAPPGRALDICGNLELLEHVRRWLAVAGTPTEPD